MGFHRVGDRWSVGRFTEEEWPVPTPGCTSAGARCCALRKAGNTILTHR